MGSWNANCVLSGLQIKYETPVKVVFLAVKDYVDVDAYGHCYSDSVWFPIGLPMDGEYNNYGSIEKIENERAIDLNTKLFFGDDKEFVLSDCDEEPPTDIYSVLKLAERGEIIWNSYKIGIAIANAHIWDYTIKSVSNWPHFRGEKLIDGLNYFVEENIRCISSFKRPDDLEFLERNTISNLGLSVWTPACGLTREELTEYAIIKYYLSKMGKKWDIQSNKGSQDTNWFEFAEYYEYVSKFARKLQSDFDDY